MESELSAAKSGQQATVKRVLMSRLIDAVKQCQTTFGATKTIASESHMSVSYLLNQLESVLYHGLKKNPSMLNTIKDVAEWVTPFKLDNFLASGSPGDSFWACLRTLLSESEIQRVHNLHNVMTDTGRARSWLRSSLNERSFRRYLDQLVNDKQLLEAFYEERAFLRDSEASAVFPQVCSGLATILFSLDPDNMELDLQSHILNDEAFEALLEAKKAPQPIMAVRTDSRNRLDSSGSGSGSQSGGGAAKLGSPAYEIAGSESYWKDRFVKQQETTEQLRYDLRTIRDEHLQFVRHQSARLELVMKEQETVRDLWRRKLTNPISTNVTTADANDKGDGSKKDGAEILIGEGGDSIYEKKLIQLTQMHGELLDLNESLQKQLHIKTSVVRRLKDELMALRGPLPEDFSTETNAGSTSTNVNLWVPTAFLTGKGTDVHHVYQIYIRLKFSEWNVYRRYTDFERMHKELIKKDAAINQFRLPPKRKFGSKEKSFVEERRKQLEAYLRLMVNYVVRNFPEFQAININKEFLGQLIPFFRE